MLVRDFFTPKEIWLMKDGYKEERGFEDYPVDFCRPKMISEKTLKKMMKEESLDDSMKTMSKAVAVMVLCLCAAEMSAQDYAPRRRLILMG